MSGHYKHINFTGLPAMPMLGELLSGSGTGEVTVMIKTVASGIEDPSQVFWFVIIPYTDTTEEKTVPHVIPNYQSGTFAKIIVSGLDQGERYRFNATAVNMFGASEVATSNLITAGIGYYTLHESIMLLTYHAWSFIYHI